MGHSNLCILPKCQQDKWADFIKMTTNWLQITGTLLRFFKRVASAMNIKDIPKNEPEAEIKPPVDTEAADADASAVKDPRTLTQICLAPLAFPPRGTSVAKWMYYLLGWPIRLCLCLTTPDCRSPKWRRLQGHWISFVVCCFWIGVFTTLMMWMITIIGRYFDVC